MNSITTNTDYEVTLHACLTLIVKACVRRKYQVVTDHNSTFDDVRTNSVVCTPFRDSNGIDNIHLSSLTTLTQNDDNHSYPLDRYRINPVKDTFEKDLNSPRALTKATYQAMLNEFQTIFTSTLRGDENSTESIIKRYGIETIGLTCEFVNDHGQLNLEMMSHLDLLLDEKLDSVKDILDKIKQISVKDPNAGLKKPIDKMTLRIEHILASLVHYYAFENAYRSLSGYNADKTYYYYVTATMRDKTIHDLPISESVVFAKKLQLDLNHKLESPHQLVELVDVINDTAYNIDLTLQLINEYEDILSIFENEASNSASSISNVVEQGREVINYVFGQNTVSSSRVSKIKTSNPSDRCIDESNIVSALAKPFLVMFKPGINDASFEDLELSKIAKKAFDTKNIIEKILKR